MKLNLSPRELLALYNALYERFDGIGSDDVELQALRNGDAAQLEQVYKRIRSIVVSGLSGKQASDPVDDWFQDQQQKIDGLSKANDEIRDAVRDPDFLIPDNILTDDNNEVPDDLPGYPKHLKQPKRPPPPHVPRPGKRHRKR